LGAITISRTPSPSPRRLGQHCVEMRVVAIVLLMVAAVMAALAVWAAIAVGREYGFQRSWELLPWGVVFPLAPAVPGVLLLRRWRKERN
jgi:tellurite resistance protein TehA-like permease